MMNYRDELDEVMQKVKTAIKDLESLRDDCNEANYNNSRMAEIKEGGPYEHDYRMNGAECRGAVNAFNMAIAELEQIVNR